MKDVKEITTELENGVKSLYESGKYAEYLTFMGKFYSYSANNCLLIYMQKPNASLVAGYKAWQTKFGRYVKKGEKGITILAPVPHKIVKEIVTASGETEEKEIRWNTFRAIKVFDVSQTDGQEVPSICDDLQGTLNGFQSLWDKLVRLSPVPVEKAEIQGLGHGYFNVAENKIVVKDGMSETQTVKTLVHEIAHAILHNEKGEEKDADRRTKEVQAESVAYTVCSAIGLDTADYSFGYVAGWSAGKEVKELTASMETIRKTSAMIIDKLRAA